MPTQRIVPVVLLAFACSIALPAAAATDAPMAVATASNAGLTLEPLAPYETAILTVTGDGRSILRQRFAPGESIVFYPVDSARRPLPDGTYTWELRLATDPYGEKPQVSASSGQLEVRGGGFVESGPQPMGPTTPALNAGPDVVGLFTATPDPNVELHIVAPVPEIRLENSSLGESWDLRVSTTKFQIVDTDATFKPEVLEISGDAMGAYTLTFDGIVEHGSSRELKRDLEPASGELLLATLRALPLYTWSYKGNADGVRHFGPMAEDFHAAFGLGGDDKHISSADTAGLALAAIQALAERLDEKERELADLRARLEALETPPSPER